MTTEQKQAIAEDLRYVKGNLEYLSGLTEQIDEHGIDDSWHFEGRYHNCDVLGQIQIALSDMAGSLESIMETLNEQ